MYIKGYAFARIRKICSCKNILENECKKTEKLLNSIFSSKFSTKYNYQKKIDKAINIFVARISAFKNEF